MDAETSEKKLYDFSNTPMFSNLIQNRMDRAKNEQKVSEETGNEKINESVTQNTEEEEIIGETTVEHIPQNIDENISNSEFDYDAFEKTVESISNWDTAKIFHDYENFIKCLPKHLKPISVEKTLTELCCGSYCCHKFSSEFVRRVRMTIPIRKQTVESVYNSVLQFHYMLIRSCCIDKTKFSAKIADKPICKEFFCKLYIINKHRFENLICQAFLQLHQALPHSNTGKTYKHETTMERVAKLVNIVDKFAQPHPDGSGYLMAAGMSKADLIKHAAYNTVFEINPTQEIKNLKVTLHFQKANSFLKCQTCIKLKIASEMPTIGDEAKAHLKNHYENITLDSQDYNIRKSASRTSNMVLSIAHDGMSKDKTKFPHLLEFNTKKLSDILKFMCSLNLAVVHRPIGTVDNQLHCFWNIGQMNGSTSNTTISQIYFTISKCDPIPSQIAIQFDNCRSNKCYNMLGALGLLLLYVPSLTKIYLCSPEVGHSHNDVDREFGLLAKQLKSKEVYTPQGYQRFAQEHLAGVVTNDLFPVTYDFDSFTKDNIAKHDKIFDNHCFEITRTADADIILRLARFNRSEKYLIKEGNKSPIYPIFKEKPDISKYPDIIPPQTFDEIKHFNLCKQVAGALKEKPFAELQQLPEFIKNRPAPETFETLIDRIRSKVIPATEIISIPEDPENIQIEEFLSNETLQKAWSVKAAEILEKEKQRKAEAKTKEKIEKRSAMGSEQPKKRTRKSKATAIDSEQPKKRSRKSKNLNESTQSIDE